KHARRFSVKLSEVINRPTIVVWALSTILLALNLPVRAAAPDPAGVEFFEKKIRPVLVERCYKCHSAESEKLKGGLHLDTAEGIKRAASRASRRLCRAIRIGRC